MHKATSATKKRGRSAQTNVPADPLYSESNLAHRERVVSEIDAWMEKRPNAS